METKVSTIILAAGQSTRMGYPKALTQFEGRSFLHTVMGHFEQVGMDDILVVLGHEAQRIRRELRLPQSRLVINENYKMGQFSSFQVGVRALSEDIAGAFLALVDQPQIGADVIRSVLASFSANPEQIVIPAYRGKRGHPTLFPRRLFEEISAAPTSISARDILAAHQADILEVDVQDESIMWNINTESDLERVQQRVKKMRRMNTCQN